MWVREWLAGGGSLAAVFIIAATAAMGLVLGGIRLGRVRLGIAGVLFGGLGVPAMTALYGVSVAASLAVTLRPRGALGFPFTALAEAPRRVAPSLDSPA